MKSLKRILALLVSAAILIAIFSRIDPQSFLERFTDINWSWFVLSMLVFVPIYIMRCAVLRILLDGEIGFGNALRSILAGDALNMILPSKGGDLAKGGLIYRHVDADLKTCFSVVLLERVLDVTALALILLAGAAILGDASKPQSAAVLIGLAFLLGSATYFTFHLWNIRSDRIKSLVSRLPKVTDFIDTSRTFVRKLVGSKKFPPLFSLVIAMWLVNVFQFYCFFQVLDYQGPWTAVLAYVPAVIFIGLLPITVAGLGTRDLALIFFFLPWAPPELTAGVGLLSHLRYLLPSLVGGGITYLYIGETEGFHCGHDR